MRIRAPFQHTMLVMTDNSNGWIIPIPRFLFVLFSYLYISVHNMVAIITHLLIWVKWLFGHIDSFLLRS